MSDIDARASEEADCNANDRDLDRFIYSGEFIDDIFKCSFSIFSFIKLDINKIDVMHLNFRRTKAQKHRAGLSHWSGR